MSAPSVDLNKRTLAESRPFSGTVVWVLRAICVCALSVSGYLAWTALHAEEVYGCSGDVFDCGHVLSSGWSRWFGIPVSLPAVALYASLLAILTFVHQKTPPELLRRIRQTLTLGGTVAGLAAIWFIGLQIFAIQHFCIYCLAAHSCGLAIAGIVWWRNPFELRQMTAIGSLAVGGLGVLIAGQILTPAPQTFIVEHFDDISADDAEFSESDSGDHLLFAAPDAEVFAAPGEVSEPPAAGVENIPVSESDKIAGNDERNEEVVPQLPANAEEAAKAEKSIETAPVETDQAAENESLVPLKVDQRNPRVAASLLLFFSPSMSTALKIFSPDQVDVSDTKDQQTSVPPEAVELKPRIVSAAGGRFRLNAAQWPILGKPTAKFVVVEMFDYTCPHCRNSHRTIKEAFRKYGDDLAIIALAVPLNPACNSAATSRSAQNAESCELARISIAVWRVAPDRFREFHDWMFDGGRNRTAAEARKQAEQLVGQELLQKELSQKTVSEYISRHVELYKKVGSGSVPKLLFPKSSMTGEVNSLSAFSQAIEREFPDR